VLPAIQPVETTAEVAGVFRITSQGDSVLVVDGSVRLVRGGTFTSPGGELKLPAGAVTTFIYGGVEITLPNSGEVGKVGLWLPGATHSISGIVWDLGVKGYVFIGDPAYPLHFKLISDKGYAYLCGRGSVTTPEGKTWNLRGYETLQACLQALQSKDALTRESGARAVAFAGDGDSIPTLENALVSEKQEAVKIAIKDTIEVLRAKQQLPARSASDLPESTFRPAQGDLASLLRRRCETRAALKMQKDATGKEEWYLEVSGKDQKIECTDSPEGIGIHTGSVLLYREKGPDAMSLFLRGENLVLLPHSRGKQYVGSQDRGPGRLYSTVFADESGFGFQMGDIASCFGVGSRILFNADNWVKFFGKLYRNGGFEVTPTDVLFLDGTETQLSSGEVYRYEGKKWSRAKQ